MPPRGRIAIVGAGSLGSSVAFALVMRKSVSEILLVDLSTELLQGQVIDLNQASFGTSTCVRAGTLKEAGQCDVIILTADSPRRNKEPRSEWIKRNLKLYQSIATAMMPIHSRTIVIIACEPVDILTRYLQQTIPLADRQIFGIGTITLTAARVREWFTIMSGAGSESKVRSYVLGNADVPVIAWHDAKINGRPAEDFPVLEEHRALAEQLVSWNRMQHLEASKGGAWFGFAATLTRLTESLVKNKPSIHVLSVYVERFQTCVSVPVTVAAGGIQGLVEVDLSKQEEIALERAAAENAQETSAIISLVGPLQLS